MVAGGRATYAANSISKVWVNGRQDAPTNGPPNNSLKTASNFQIGTKKAVGVNTKWFDGTIEYVLQYNRFLQNSEISWLYEEPYAFVQPIKRRLYFSVPSAPDTSGTIVFGNATALMASGAPNTASLSMIVDVSAGNNRILFVGTMSEGAAGAVTPLNVTLNGTSLTKQAGVIAAAGANRTYGSLWYLLDASLPAVSGNATATFTTSGAVGPIGMGYVLLHNVDQTAPIASGTRADGGTSTFTLTATSLALNNWIIDNIALSVQLSASTTTLGQTERYDLGIAGSAAAIACSTREVSGVGDFSVSWVTTGATNSGRVSHVLAGIAPFVSAAGVGGFGIMTTRSHWWGDI